MLAEAGSLPSLPHVAQVQRSNAGKKAVSGSGSQRKHYKTESKDNFVYIQYIAKKQDLVVEDFQDASGII